MNKRINEKIIEISSDEVFISNLRLVVGILNDLKIQYSIFGSCGIQSYFDYFFRLPNDIDIVIKKTKISILKSYCVKNNFKIVEKHDRLKITFGKININIIPDKLEVISELSNSTCGTINLEDFGSTSTNRQVKLVGAKDTFEVIVLPLEMNLFLELFRALYTNSISTIFYIFKIQRLRNADFLRIISSHYSFKELIISRLSEFSKKLVLINLFSESDIAHINLTVSNLIKEIEGLNSDKTAANN